MTVVVNVSGGGGSIASFGSAVSGTSTESSSHHGTAGPDGHGANPLHTASALLGWFIVILFISLPFVFICAHLVQGRFRSAIYGVFAGPGRLLDLVRSVPIWSSKLPRLPVECP